MRCAGVEQLTFLKALKQTKGLTGTTEQLKEVKVLRSSWVPASPQAQLAEPAGHPSVQPPFSAPLPGVSQLGGNAGSDSWGHNGNSKNQTQCSALEKCN